MEVLVMREDKMYRLFILFLFFVSSFLGCNQEGSKRGNSGKQSPAATPTATNAPNGEEPNPVDPVDLGSSAAWNCATPPTGGNLNIHQKYCAFNRELWVDFKDKYFRKDGQHVDRWQEQGGPELWHIPDGGVVQGMLLGAYVLEYSWSKSPESMERVKFLMQGMEILEKVTGVPGLIARCAIKKDGRTPPDWLKQEGLIYKDSAVADYIHRSDVSGDQYSGLAWGLSVAVHHGTPEVKKWASDYAKRVVRYLEVNEWRLKVDGAQTEHGDTAPTDNPLGALGGILGIVNGMHIAKILALFKTANLVDPDPAIVESEKRFVSEWSGKGSFEVGRGALKKSDNEFQVSSNFQALLSAAPDDTTYRKLFKDFVTNGQYLESNAFDDFALIFQVGPELGATEVEKVKKSAMNALETFPFPKMIRNAPDDRFVPSSLTTPLPVNKRVINSWSWGENPYVEGMEPTPEAQALKHRFSPLDYITVYNMGRAYGIISE